MLQHEQHDLEGRFPEAVACEEQEDVDALGGDHILALGLKINQNPKGDSDTATYAKAEPAYK